MTAEPQCLFQGLALSRGSRSTAWVPSIECFSCSSHVLSVACITSLIPSNNPWGGYSGSLTGVTDDEVET